MKGTQKTMLKIKVMSCQHVSGTSSKTGNKFSFYNLFFLMNDGSVAKIAARNEHKAGDDVTLNLVTNRDGFLALALQE